MDDDAALLHRHAEGDPDAFGELVLRHRDRLWAVALRTLGDREEAADALQDAMVTPWLHRIVVNACIDRARRRAARPTVPLDEQSTSVPDQRDDMATVDLRGELLAALAALPIEQAAALVLVDVEGRSVEETARMLDVPVGTVKSRCARGRARLAVSLGHLRPTRNPTVPPAVQPAPSELRPDPGKEVQAP